MTSLKIGEFSVGSPSDPVFIIAEIGQNHQGDLKIAKQIIDEAKRIGCNSVKFQKSCLTAKFTKAALDRPYVGSNSWGTTYGEHKAFLEFSIDQYKMLQEYSQQLGIMFSASAMDEKSLEQLSSLNLPFLKIGSGDANNFPLLEKASRIDCPLIISTGMQTASTIENIVKIMEKSNKINYALLHCVSSYPTDVGDCNLMTIPLLQKMFPEVVIGYSGHEVAPLISQAAVLLGAKIIERHITLDKSQKGSDHSCSLTPNEFQHLVKTIRSYESNSLLQIPQSPKFIVKYFNGDENIKKSLRQINSKYILNCELICRMKLGKSLVTSRIVRNGQMLTLSDIAVKVCEPPGLTAECLKQCLGKKVLYDLDEDVPLQSKYLSEFK